MKSNTKSKIIILITLGILFALIPKITINPSFITGNSDVTNLDNENLKISAVSGKIHIINNSGWVDFRNAGNCTGSGTYSDPYVIEDLVIDGGSSGNSILIENSNVYFKIENCTLYNTEWGSDAGIGLLNVNNSQLIGNDCSYSQVGIVLGDVLDYSGGCYNNTITGNIVNNNRGGMYLFDSYNNTISSNTANNNTWSGIYLVGSNYTVVSGNTMKDNKMCGINIGGGHNNVIVSGNIISENYMQGLWMDESFNNTISGNIIDNNNFSGICLIDSNYNVISGNTANNNNECGIVLFYSNYNTISGNTANNNKYGIILYNNGYNIVSGNTLIGNDECIVELNCQGNVIQDNDCTTTPSLNYLPSILIISTAIIGVSVFMIYKNGRKFKKPQEDLDFL
ncbi:MAG: right-handed parallel beta-helix repeat-containing protein [Candidatus Lokiarchaeota archaeon]|nr:right-handed parallel beta-helix repeat-containing protein [Candidatus Lokiarchaeota archaeon]